MSLELPFLSLFLLVCVRHYVCPHHCGLRFPYLPAGWSGNCNNENLNFGHSWDLGSGIANVSSTGFILAWRVYFILSTCWYTLKSFMSKLPLLHQLKLDYASTLWHVDMGRLSLSKGENYGRPQTTCWCPSMEFIPSVFRKSRQEYSSTRYTYSGWFC